jgi:ketosteroid isomerase-like protein
MSQANVELVRQQIGAWNRRAEDWPEFYDSEAAFHMPKEWPEDAVYSGHDGIRRVDALLADSFDEYHWDVERLIDSSECVIGLYRARGRIKDGGAWLEQPVGAVYDFRGDKILRVRTYFTWQEALEAAGLEG